MKYYLGDADGNRLRELSFIDAMKETEKRGVYFQFLAANTFRVIIREEPHDD